MNRWKGILEFVAVIEAGSFSKAAENMDIAVSQVSKRINDLENRLGTRLIHRSTRSIKLSQQGEAYYDSCKKIIEEFNRAEDRVAMAQDSARGKLKLCIVGGSRPAFQVALFAEFLKTYPDINLEIIFCDELPNLIENRIDMALVTGLVGDCPYPGIRLAWVDYQLCASQAFVDKHGVPEHPSELEDYSCIISDTSIWKLHHLEEEDDVEVEVSGQWKSMNIRACIDASISGLGIFMMPSFSVDEVFAQKKLVPVLPGWVIRKPLWGIAPHVDYVPAKLTLLQNYLQTFINIDQGEIDNEAVHLNAGKLGLISEMQETIQREEPLFDKEGS